MVIREHSMMARQLSEPLEVSAHGFKDRSVWAIVFLSKLNLLPR